MNFDIDSTLSGLSISGDGFFCKSKQLTEVETLEVRSKRFKLKIKEDNQRSTFC